MTSALVGAAFFGVLVALTTLVGRLDRAVAPRVAAGAHLVGLVGWALLPAVWLACAGSAFASWLGGRGPGGGCLLGLDPTQWQLLGEVPGLLVAAVMVWHGLRQVLAARRVELRAVARAGAVPRPTSAGVAWVVPSPVPAAFAAGLWRCRAVVSSGLLASLAPEERAAVCEHEVAHVRLGHPRLLLVAGVVVAAYGWLPPVRRAWEGLRRALEAAADDEAARVVGPPTMIAALAASALLVRSPARRVASDAPDGPDGRAGPDIAHDDATGLGGPELLRWRIGRLAHPRAAGRWSSLTVGGSAVGTAAAMALLTCRLAGASISLVGVAGCLGALALVGLRPVWAWGRHRLP